MDPVARDAALLDEIASARLGRRPIRIEPIPAGLGARRFHRLFFDAGEPRTLVARIEPDPTEAPAPPAGEVAPPAWFPEPPLEPLRGWLEAAGLPVPKSALHDPAHGLDLLEDVGDRTLLDLTGEERDARYREAAALVPRLQRLTASPDEIPAFGRPYDARLVASKAWKWLHWTIPGLLGRDASLEEERETGALFDHIAQLATAAPARLAHRDFKAENLHLVAAAGGGPARLVMIDVQGACLAPPEYDLVCLLYDLQVELPEAFVQAVFEETRAMLPDADSATEVNATQERFDALALARLCKDVSHVVHAARSRGDARRWHEIPRGLALIRRIVGRRQHTFPGVRALTCVIDALTGALQSADSAERG